MRRRGNKSHKVPNVRLRPAEKGAYAQTVEESCWAQDTQPEDEASYTHDNCPRPLKGFSICATGVQDKQALFKKAVELGATYTPAFTDRVTHLIADDHGGAKYMFRKMLSKTMAGNSELPSIGHTRCLFLDEKPHGFIQHFNYKLFPPEISCALERKIPIVKPSWIGENYQIWLRGDDVDVEKSIEQHRLPIFSGVVVCPSGITDITRRTRISKLVTAHDGEYLKVLERPVRVTHLLCSGDEETDKMRYAEKFNARKEAQIHLVWEEWFWDSIDFGGRFDEATYQVTRPRPERKSLPVAAGRSSSPPPTSDIPSEHDEIPSSSAGSQQAQAQPRDPDEGEDEPAFVNVLPVVTLQLWNSLLGRRGYEISDGEVILSPTKADSTGAGAGKKKRQQVQQQPPSPVPQERQFGAERSVISAFKRANSFAPAVVAGSSSRQLPFRRTTTAMAVLGDDKAKASTSALSAVPPVNKDTAAATATDSTKQQQASISSKIFNGMRFRVLGEAKCSNVRTAIDELGGVMLSADEGEEEDVDFVIVRLVSGSKFYRDEEDERLRAKYRTECWLEQCIYENRICPPEEQVSSVPLGISLPVLGAEHVVMALSGFDQSQVCGLKRLLRALGINLSSTFSKRCTHLLCPSGTGQKFDKSREWGIPVVNLDWLRAVSCKGVVPRVDEFLVDGSVVLPYVIGGGGGGGEREDDGMDVDVETDVDVGRRRRRDKGKGKAVDRGDGMDVDVQNRMQDITNDIPSEPKQPIQNQKKARPIPIPIGRRATTILPTPEPHASESEPGHMSFGMPNELLGGPAPAVLSRQPSAAISSKVSTPIRGSRAREDPFAEDVNDQNSDNSSNSNSNTRSAALRNSKTILNIDEEREQSGRERHRGDRIPSSKSPSPMKILRKMGSRSSSSLSLTMSSPVKIDIDHVATKALQESITSLLGKRPSPDGEGEDEEIRVGGGGVVCAGGVSVSGGEGGGGGVAGVGGGGAVRNAKRSRPQRTKAQTRQSSESKVIAAPPPVLPARRRTRSSRLSQTPSVFGGNSFDQSYKNNNNKNVAPNNTPNANVTASQQQGNSNENEDDESQENSSIRVMYEDPIQKEERKRLLKLLKGGDESSISSGSSVMSGGSGSGNGRRAGMRRNSTRVAGF